MEVDLEFYGWIRKADQGTEENEPDTTAEIFWQGDARRDRRGLLPSGGCEGLLGVGAHGDGGARRQGLDVSTDLLDLGDEPNPWWSEGVQREFRREAQLAAEQPMWTPDGNEVSLEEPPAIDDADASGELEPLQAMGMMSAPSTTWGTATRGRALQTQGEMPTGDEDPQGQQLHRVGLLQGVGLDLQGQDHRGAGQVHGENGRG